MAENDRKRLELLDGVRGLAVAIMIAFHLTFDLRTFGNKQFATLDSIPTPLFRGIAGVIAITFMLSSGAALTLAQNAPPAKQRRPLWKRSTPRLAVAAIIVTVGSAMFDWRNIILFGILHFLLFARLVSRPLLKMRTWALAVLGVALIALSPLLDKIRVTTLAWVWIGIYPKAWRTGDYFPLIPWLGIYVAGILWGRWLARAEKIEHAWPPAVLGMGRRSLAIYLIHQPIMIGLLRWIGWIRL